jgi:hypothetical protein
MILSASEYHLRPATTSPTNTHIIDVSELNGSQILEALESYNLPDPEILLEQENQEFKSQPNFKPNFSSKWSPTMTTPPLCTGLTRATFLPPTHTPSTNKTDTAHWENGLHTDLNSAILTDQTGELLDCGVESWDDSAWASLQELYDC